MKINKEATIGAAVILLIFVVIAGVTGIYGIIYLGLAFVLAVISINLFSHKSLAAKTSAIILNTDLIYKILMPRKYKKTIKELEEHEKKHNKSFKSAGQICRTTQPACGPLTHMSGFKCR